MELIYLIIYTILCKMGKKYEQKFLRKKYIWPVEMLKK